MVVMVIIGILATFLSLSIGNRAVEDRMQVEARRLQQLLLIAAEEAQLKGFEIGLRHTTEGFEFLGQDQTGRWQSIEAGPLRPREIAAPFYLELYVEGRLVPPMKIDREEERRRKRALEEEEARKQEGKDVSERDDDKEDLKDALQPQVYMLSSGESSSFALDLHLRDYPGFYRVECDLLSRCKLERLQERT